MKSILEELFYGRTFPFERIVPHDPGYRPLNQTRDYHARKSLEIDSIFKSKVSTALI